MLEKRVEFKIKKIKCDKEVYSQVLKTTINNGVIK